MSKFKEGEGFFSVAHKEFCTDHYEMGETIVKANSKQEAMDKLNTYLSTMPDGGYTADPCKSIKDVRKIRYLD